MKGVYGFVELNDEGDEDNQGGETKEAELGVFHFVLPAIV